jgi:uncharacterized protein YkwD
MKPTVLSVIALFAVLSFSCSTDTVDDAEIDTIIHTYVPPTKVIEIEIAELINAYRIEQGLSTLGNMDVIKAQAFGHTDYMIENDEVSHANFHARRANLVNAVGATSVGENVAYAYSSAEAVVNAWINSEGHRNVIEGNYDYFDISAEKDADGKWYYTNIFLR